MCDMMGWASVIAEGIGTYRAGRRLMASAPESGVLVGLRALSTVQRATSHKRSPVSHSEPPDYRDQGVMHCFGRPSMYSSFGSRFRLSRNAAGLMQLIDCYFSSLPTAVVYHLKAGKSKSRPRSRGSSRRYSIGSATLMASDFGIDKGASINKGGHSPPCLPRRKGEPWG